MCLNLCETTLCAYPGIPGHPALTILRMSGQYFNLTHCRRRCNIYTIWYIPFVLCVVPMHTLCQTIVFRSCGVVMIRCHIWPWMMMPGMKVGKSKIFFGFVACSRGSSAIAICPCSAVAAFSAVAHLSDATWARWRRNVQWAFCQIPSCSFAPSNPALGFLVSMLRATGRWARGVASVKLKHALGRSLWQREMASITDLFGSNSSKSLLGSMYMLKSTFLEIEELV